LNLLLLLPEDFGGDPPPVPEPGSDEVRVVLSGRRSDYVRRVHRAEPGNELEVGLLGGRLGRGRILRVGGDGLELAVRLDCEPPAPLACTLVLALPRPLVLKRVLVHATTLGVKRIALIHSRRVEKSYWQSDALRDEAVREQLLLGLEQARDTVLPRVTLHRRFRPFVEDELGALLTESQGFVPDPGCAVACPRGVTGPITLAIGPEGGFVRYEVDRLVEAGLARVHLGARILRVEAAVPYAIARLS
jgi:RsmE family RNA methyltransferase